MTSCSKNIAREGHSRKGHLSPLLQARFQHAFSLASGAPGREQRRSNTDLRYHDITQTRHYEIAEIYCSQCSHSNKPNLAITMFLRSELKKIFCFYTKNVKIILFCYRKLLPLFIHCLQRL